MKKYKRNENVFTITDAYLFSLYQSWSDSLLGFGWLAMHNDLNVPISFMGIVSMVISEGTIVSSLLSDKLTKRLGTQIVTVSSVFLTVIALYGFSFSVRFCMHFNSWHYFPADSYGKSSRITDWFYHYRTWLCADLSVYHSFHTQ